MRTTPFISMLETKEEILLRNWYKFIFLSVITSFEMINRKEINIFDATIL